MCGFLERSGFQTFCGRRFVDSPESIVILPNAIVGRLDGCAAGDEDVRLEFRTLDVLHRQLPDVPIIAVVDDRLSKAEEALTVRDELIVFNRRSSNYDQFVEVISRSLIQQRS